MLHPLNRLIPSNEGGVAGIMVRDVKPVQSEKAQFPIDVTELGMVRDVKPEQPARAHSPIDVTELGMMMDVKLVQPEKA